MQLDGQTAGYFGGGDAGNADDQSMTVVDDGDEVAVPPPPLEYLAHGHPALPAGVRAAPKYQSLAYKQTLIPILLTMGLCLSAIAICKEFFREDTFIGAQPVWMRALFFGFSGLSFVFGVLIMLQVKNTLDKQQREAAERLPA